MGVPPEIHTRAKRLLDGRATSSDLDRLFLWLRERPYGRRLVRDIGDFVAHWGERDQGVTWEHANQLFITMELMVKIYRKRVTMPDVAPALRAALAMEPHTRTKKMLRIGKRRARQVLERAIPKIVDVHNGENPTLVGDFTPLEGKVLVHYFGTMDPREIFTQDELVEELADLLIDLHVVQKNQRGDLLQQSNFIAAYAITKMHSANILWEGHDPVSLSLSVEDGHLVIRAGGRIWVDGPIPGHQPTTFSVVAFRSKCRPKEWCGPTMIFNQRSNLRPVELGADRLIVEVR